MAYCPSCAAELAADAARCPGCDARFDADATWVPLAEPAAPVPPSRTQRLFAALGKLLCVAVSGAFLFLGGIVAASEKGPLWAAACAIAGAAVVAIAFMARLRWSVLAMLCAVPLGFVSCAANFKWHGG